MAASNDIIEGTRQAASEGRPVRKRVAARQADRSKFSLRIMVASLAMMAAAAVIAALIW